MYTHFFIYLLIFPELDGIIVNSLKTNARGIINIVNCEVHFISQLNYFSYNNFEKKS